MTINTKFLLFYRISMKVNNIECRLFDQLFFKRLLVLYPCLFVVESYKLIGTMQKVFFPLLSLFLSFFHIFNHTINILILY